jgi:hypothetical protein
MRARVVARLNYGGELGLSDEELKFQLLDGEKLTKKSALLEFIPRKSNLGGPQSSPHNK